MNIESWFPTIIAYTDDNLIPELPVYYNLCDSITKDIPPGKPFIGSHLVSTLNYKNINWNIDISKDQRFKALMELALEQGSKYSEFLGFQYELEITNAWINRIHTHDYHGFHSHSSSGNALISGCFYVASPVGSMIAFKSPYADDHSPIDPSFETPYNSKIVQYACVPGRLLFFKANILHGYDSHNSDEIKFSIAFNIAVKKLK